MRTMKEKALAVAVVVLAVVAVWSVWKAITEPYTCEKATHIVQEGDTISGIVRQYCRGNLSQADYDFVKKYGTLIHPTQRIEVGE